MRWASLHAYILLLVSGSYRGAFLLCAARITNSKGCRAPSFFSIGWWTSYETNAEYFGTVLQLLSCVRSFWERHEGHSCRFWEKVFEVSSAFFVFIVWKNCCEKKKEPRRNENTTLCFAVSLWVNGTEVKCKVTQNGLLGACMWVQSTV